VVGLAITVEEFILTRYPTLHVRIVNAGVPGDTTYGGYAGAMAEQRRGIGGSATLPAWDCTALVPIAETHNMRGTTQQPE
jgi:hypothetical protein